MPRDGGAAGLRRRLGFAFADVGDALAGREGAWRLPVPAEEVSARALAALPAELTQPMVVLHSNPGQAHVCADMAVIAAGSPYAEEAAADLTGRLGDL